MRVQIPPSAPPFYLKIKKDWITTRYRYLYDGLDIVQELDDAGAVTANYVRSLNIDEPLARIEADGTTRYYHADALGSVTALTDASEAVQTRYKYESFGKTEMTLDDGHGAANPFRYTGRELDETGDYYYRARYYDAEVGRFVSEDPIGFGGGGMNWYVYVENRPVNRIDPLGLLTVHLWNYRGKYDAWGHASITLEDGTHISWWPDEPRNSNPLFPNIYSAPAFKNQSFADDVSFEGQYPDVQIKIYGLDESRIKNWWLNFKQNNSWQTLSQNCSTTVAEALKVGSGSRGVWVECS